MADLNSVFCIAAQPSVIAQRLLLWAANVKGSSKQKKTAPKSGFFLVFFKVICRGQHVFHGNIELAVFSAVEEIHEKTHDHPDKRY